jgi:predicted TIM-barrel fold metal-dependent hydrolase
MLAPYLSQRWQEHQQTIGIRCPTGYLYPKGSPLAARTDAWPPGGGPPGSDLPFLRAQLLDQWHINVGVLNCLHEVAGEQNPDYAAALARAINDWMLAHWLEPEPRLRASIVVPQEYPDVAAAEIDRLGADKRFVQVLLLVRSTEPFGHRRYWPIYEAAARHNLPIGIHFGGRGGNPITASGWPSYYIEDHTGMAQAFQAQVVSLICGGVFTRFPTLRVVLMEGGFAWMPALMWRLDRSRKQLRTETPWLTRPPSELIRERMYLTTQPMEEPEQPGHLQQVIEALGSDTMLLFATDYPHWDFDAPTQAFPIALPKPLERKIMAENARALYQL